MGGHIYALRAFYNFHHTEKNPTNPDFVDVARREGQRSDSKNKTTGQCSARRVVDSEGFIVWLQF